MGIDTAKYRSTIRRHSSGGGVMHMKILSFGLSEKVERILLYDREQVTGSLLLVICLGLAVHWQSWLIIA